MNIHTSRDKVPMLPTSQGAFPAMSLLKRKGTEKGLET